MLVNGEADQSRVLQLHDKKRKTFRRGGVDTFIVSMDSPLGNIACIRVWHDNSGRGTNNANWYLKHVIINDLASHKKFFFLCERWLAVEKDDGKIERIIPAAGHKEKNDLKYLMKKETKEKLSESHLWYSILARPVQSAFGRLDRLTCIFVLLCISMLANIMYYGTASNTLNPNALNIGPFTLSPEQIGIGIMTNLIVFPPSFLIMQLFRRARDRQQDKLDKVLKKPKKKGLKRFETCPWWTNIFAYLFSLGCAIVSIFFILWLSTE
jgi:polycystin 1L2